MLPDLKKTMAFIEMDTADFQRALLQGSAEEWILKQFGSESVKNIPQSLTFGLTIPLTHVMKSEKCCQRRIRITA